MRGFISFHIEQSEIFHNVRQNIISYFAEQNISLYAFAVTKAMLEKKRTENAFALSVLFLLKLKTVL